MSAQKQKPSSRKKRKGLRLLAGLLIGLPVLILLLLSVIALVPSRTAGGWLSSQLSAATGMTVSLEEAAVNPFGSVRIKNAAMLTPAGDTLAAVNWARIDYRILPLFSRTVAVRRIVIDRPVIHLPFPADMVAEKQLPDSTGMRYSPETASLPLTFGLWSLDLSNLAVSLVLPGDGPVKEAGISGIGLELENVYLPRGAISAGSPSHGAIRLFSNRGNVTLTDSTGSYRRALHLDLRLAKDANGGWQAALDAALGTPAHADIVRLFVDAQGDLSSGTAALERCDLLLSGTELLRMTGNVTLAEPPRRVDITLSGEPLFVPGAVRDLLTLLPPSLAGLSVQDLPAATLQLFPGTVSGTVDSLVVFAAAGAGLPVFTPDSGTRLESARLSISGHGIAAGGRLQSATVSADAGLKRVILTLPDSTRFTAGPLDITLGTEIDSSLLPVHGRVTAGLDSLLGGRIDLVLGWRIPGARIQDMILSADLSADSLAVEAIPSVPETVSGLLAAELHLQAAGTDSIGADLEIGTDGLDYALADRAEQSGPLRIKTVLTAAALDTLFQRWRIDTLSADINRIAVLSGAGSWNSAAGTAEIPSWRLDIENSRIIPVLPAGLREALQYLTISGREIVQGSLRMQGPVLSSEGRLTTEGVALRDADTGLSVEDISAILAWQGGADSLGGSIHLGLHRIAMPGYLDAPLDTVQAGTEFSLSGGAIAAEGGMLAVPALGITGGFRAIIDSARGGRQLSAEGGIRFRSDEPVRFPGGLEGCGELSLRFGALSLDSLGGRMQLSGNVESETCDLRLDTLMVLRDLKARLPFRVVVDLPDGRILTEAAYRPLVWNDYDRQRTLYRELMPEIGQAALATAEMAGQKLSGVELDVKIDNGWLEVPRFYMNTLSGNVGGKLRVHFGVKAPEPLFYEIEAQAARINAASFLTDTRAAGQATELNAVLQFSGYGIDPAAGIDLEGFFNITKIGPRFASTLLQGLDPQGKDRTIRLTRRLLNTGWKPSLFSFEARHGYVYPSLSLVQPWFSPIRLPETMKFGRLPLEFFLKPQQQE